VRRAPTALHGSKGFGMPKSAFHVGASPMAADPGENFDKFCEFCSSKVLHSVEFCFGAKVFPVSTERVGVMHDTAHLHTMRFCRVRGVTIYA